MLLFRYKLTTRDSGPRSRCFGDDVPYAQPWQNPLPVPAADYTSELNKHLPEIRKKIVDLLNEDSSNGALLVRLAWQCASTFRYRGDLF